MSKSILKSNSALLATGPSPAFKTVEESGYFMPLVQSSEFSISVDRQTSKQVGSQSYAVDDLTRSPNVNLDVSYLFSPYLVNEYWLGIYSKDSSIPSSIINRDQNFYLIINNQEGHDALKDFSEAPFRTNFSGMTCASIGNCFLSNYSLQFNVGSIPTASCSFVGSNLRFENLTGDRATIPAINLQSGNASGAGFVDFSKLAGSFVDEYSNTYRLPSLSPHNVEAKLKNLQCGGASLISGALIQSVNINIPFERTDLYGLGSNYVYGRKLNLPIRATVDVTTIVQNFNSGDITAMTNAEDFYDFTIEFFDSTQSVFSSCVIENAKINSTSYSMRVNGTMQFSASYSFNVGSGFWGIDELQWSRIDEQWQNILSFWNVL
jgi:hypothetical protein